MRKSSPLFRFLVAAMCLLGVAVLWNVFGRPVEAMLRAKPFDAVLWREQAGAESPHAWPCRLLMVDDLVASGQLLGLNQEALLSLLGPPDAVGIATGSFFENTIHYHLGPARKALALDWENLTISFSEAGDVRDARVWED